MRGEERPTAPRNDGLSENSFAVSDEHQMLQKRPTSQSSIHKSRLQNIPTKFEPFEVEEVAKFQDVKATHLQKEDKELAALEYPACIGEEDWCLSCHTNNHRAQDCLGPKPHMTTFEGERDKLLRKIPPKYILSTIHEMPRTIRGLGKEVVVHGLDSQDYREHVKQRDQLFGELFDEMSKRNMTSAQESWFRFMSSINHGMEICRGGLARRPLKVLRTAIKDRYMNADEGLSMLATRLFDSGSVDHTIPIEVIDVVKNSLDTVRCNHDTWMKKWDADLQYYLKNSPKIRKLNPADLDWIHKAFAALRTAQPQFGHRQSVWIQHLWYPEIDSIAKDF